MDLVTFCLCSDLTHTTSLVFLAQGNPVEAYTTCSSILAQLGETVPDVVTVEMVGCIIPETLSMYSRVYSDDWLEKNMKDPKLCNIVKFYSVTGIAAYFCKPTHSPAYFVCKMVQMSLRNGICQQTPLALMQLSLIAFNNTSGIPFNNAMFVR